MDELAAVLAELWSAVRDGAQAAWTAAAPAREMGAEILLGVAGWIGQADLQMPRDIAIVSAVCLGALAVPAILQAFSDRRPPVIGTVLALAAAALGAWTWQTYPGEWSFREIPLAFVEVAARILN